MNKYYHAKNEKKKQQLFLKWHILAESQNMHAKWWPANAWCVCVRSKTLQVHVLFQHLFFLFRLFHFAAVIYPHPAGCVLVRVSHFHGAHQNRVRPTFFVRGFSVAVSPMVYKMLFYRRVWCVCVSDACNGKSFSLFSSFLYLSTEWLWNPKTKTVKIVSAIQLNLFHWISHIFFFAFFRSFAVLVVYSFRSAAVHKYMCSTRFDIIFATKNNNNWIGVVLEAAYFLFTSK